MNEQEVRDQLIDHQVSVRSYLSRFMNELRIRGRAHDDSKLEGFELPGFEQHLPKLRELTYGSDEYHVELVAMKGTLKHHYQMNRHHPEHFQDGISGMSLIDVVEMFCDWWAATEKHDDVDMLKSIDINQKRFGFSDELAKIFRNTVVIMSNKIPELSYYMLKGIFESDGVGAGYSDGKWLYWQTLGMYFAANYMSRQILVVMEGAPTEWKTTMWGVTAMQDEVSAPVHELWQSELVRLKLDRHEDKPSYQDIILAVDKTSIGCHAKLDDTPDELQVKVKGDGYRTAGLTEDAEGLRWMQNESGLLDLVGDLKHTTKGGWCSLDGDAEAIELSLYKNGIPRDSVYPLMLEYKRLQLEWQQSQDYRVYHEQVAPSVYKIKVGEWACEYRPYCKGHEYRIVSEGTQPPTWVMAKYIYPEGDKISKINRDSSATDESEPKEADPKSDVDYAARLKLYEQARKYCSLPSYEVKEGPTCDRHLCEAEEARVLEYYKELEKLLNDVTNQRRVLTYLRTTKFGVDNPASLSSVGYVPESSDIYADIAVIADYENMTPLQIISFNIVQCRINLPLDSTSVLFQRLQKYVLAVNKCLDSTNHSVDRINTDDRATIQLSIDGYETGYLIGIMDYLKVKLQSETARQAVDDYLWDSIQGDVDEKRVLFGRDGAYNVEKQWDEIKEDLRFMATISQIPVFEVVCNLLEEIERMSK